MYTKIILISIVLLAISNAITGRVNYSKGYQKAKSEDAIAHNKNMFNQVMNFTKNKEVVYIPLIESHVQLEERVKKVIVYVKQKTDWNDTRCMPVSGMYGYRDSLYPNNSESTDAIIESMSRANYSTNTTGQ